FISLSQHTDQNSLSFLLPLPVCCARSSFNGGKTKRHSEILRTARVCISALGRKEGGGCLTMPLTRYRIRNEYGLADPELYRAADRDDPEALLEGVAMAGLVGILRQLGDLAEFAAEIFHHLHEEVLTTAARGHTLIARVQQLEAEVPSVEKAFPSQTDHSSFFANGGGDWHPNLHLEQNLITQGDLPRFVMVSYEECRGPPRLYMLDKFDVAGAGACLKRYTDPSIFKIEATSSTRMEFQREKKAQKIKKKSRWRNGGTPEVAPASHAKWGLYALHQLFLEERVANGHPDPARLVKMKRRLLNESPFDMKSGRSYMEKLLEIPSPNGKAPCKVSVNPPVSTLTQEDCNKPGLVIVDVTAASPVKNSAQDEGSMDSSPEDLHVVMQHLHDESNVKDINTQTVKGSETVTDSETDESPSSVHKMPIREELAIYAGEQTATLDGAKSDDMISEVDSYMDAVTNMESEIDTDKFVKQELESDKNEEHPDTQAKLLNLQSFGSSPVSDDGNSSSYKGGSSISYSDSLSNVAENTQSDGDGQLKVAPYTEHSVAETSALQSDYSSPHLGALSTQSGELLVSTYTCIKERNFDEDDQASSTSMEELMVSKSVPTDLAVDPLTNSSAGELSDNGSLENDQKTKSEEASVGIDVEDMSRRTNNLHDLDAATIDKAAAEHPYEYFDEHGHQDANYLNNSLNEADLPNDVPSVPSADEDLADGNLCPSSDLIGSPSRYHIDMHNTSDSDDQHQIGQNISSEASPEPEVHKEVTPKDREFCPDESIFQNFSESEAIKHLHHTASLRQPGNLDVGDASTGQAASADSNLLESVTACTSIEISKDDGSLISCLPDCTSIEISKDDGSPISCLPDAVTPVTPAVLHVNQTKAVQVHEATSESRNISGVAHLDKEPSDTSGIPSEQAWDLQPDQTDDTCLETDEAGSTSQSQEMETATLDHVRTPYESRSFTTSPVNPLLLPSSVQDLNGTKLPVNPFGSSSPQLDTLSTTEEDVNMVEIPPMPPLPPLQWRTGKAPPIQPPSVNERAGFGLDVIEDGENVKLLPQDQHHMAAALDPSNPSFATGSTSSRDKPELIDLPSGELELSSPESFPSMPPAANTSSNSNGSASEPDLVPEGDKHCRKESISLSSQSTPKEQLQQTVATTSHGGTFWPPTTSYELGRENRNKLPHPRNPLIDAIDKSKLRKVGERVLPDAKEEEKDSLLEQIRTKSFNLKPATATRLSMRPSMPGPRTNLKVVAILEKANAIRQAFAGSDDDDGWSD
ncbi:Protein SCAR2, partial [Linum perenne]